jgi:hypothetical protein
MWCAFVLNGPASGKMSLENIVPRSLTYSLALLFLGLQIATLFHSAQFASGPHDHGIHNAVLAEAGNYAGQPHSHGPEDPGGRAETRCDLEFFCEKTGKLVAGDAPAQTFAKTDVYRPGATSHLWTPSILANHQPRGPPVLFHS